MKKRACTVALCLSIAVAAGLRGDQQPNNAKGFEPGKAYSFHGLDAVNLFNGNLNVRVPLGGSWKVSDHLSYSLALTYAGNTWDHSYATARVLDFPGTHLEKCVDKNQQWTEPSRDSNAGIGWLFTLGQLGTAGEDEDGIINDYCPNTMGSNEGGPQQPVVWDAPHLAPSYLAPDGAVHHFEQRLNPNTALVDDVFYSVDSTYMRLKRVRINSQTEKYLLEFAGGNVHEFAPDGKLRAMSDRFGNSVSITYDDPAAPSPVTGQCGSSFETWTIDDGHRKHYAYFAKRTLHAETPRKEPYRKRLCQVKVAAFESTAGANYLFHYDNRVIARQQLGGVVPPDATRIGKTVTVPLLHKIVLPDGTDYRAVYDIGMTEPDDSSNPLAVPTEFSTIGLDNPGSFSGHLRSMVLPTGGELHYTYKSYQFPATKPPEPGPPYIKGQYRPLTVGVWTRRLTDHGRDDQWTYTSDWIGHLTTVTTVDAPNNSKTQAFFGACMTCNPPGERTEYGLPVSRHPSSAEYGTNPDPAGDWMSTRTLFADGRVRTEYVSYETREGHNPRVAGTTTVYENGDRRVVRHSGFDGLGHYRETSTSGFGATASRVTKTNFNPGRGEYPSSSIPAPAENWIIGTFNFTEVAEGGIVGTTDYCFNGENGFLERKRIRRGKPNPLADLLTIYRDADPVTNATDGNVSLEEHYGGDHTPLAFASTCTSPFANPPFSIVHQYSYGTRSSSAYGGMNFKTLDLEVDPTGLVKRSRDTALVATTFGYDSSGRIKTILGPRATTEYVYDNATFTEEPDGRRQLDVPASIVVQQCATGAPTCAGNTPLTESRYYYDGFGRLTQQRSRMGSQWTASWMTLDAVDRLTETSVATLASTGGRGAMPAGTKVSTSEYDDLGRVTDLLAPDGTCTEFGYDGIRVVTRSVSLNDCSDPLRATSVETFDVHGRLRSVNEGEGIEATVVAYDYEIDRLTEVDFGEQSRSFVYDRAGLLQSETHPESGTTQFPVYNALGSVVQRRPETCQYDLDYEYDGAGRVVEILGGCTHANPIKGFAYGSSDVNKNRGKLVASSRYNTTPVGMYVVTEWFTYGDAAGRLTKKTTAVSEAGAPEPIQSFDQEYQYNQLDALERASFPACITAVCGEAINDGVVYAYSGGLLTGVSVGRFDWSSPYTPPLSGVDSLGSLEYHPTGTVKQIDHGNAVIETIAADPDGMARPGSITVSGFDACAPPEIATQPAGGDVPAGQSVTLTVTMATSGDYTYQWYRIENGDEIAIAGATDDTYTTPSITAPVSYFVVIHSSCGVTRSANAPLTPIDLDAPAGLLASRSGSNVVLTWTPSPGAEEYEIERRTAADGDFTSRATTSATSWTDNSCPAFATCIYQVKARTGSASSPASNRDLATLITFGNLNLDNGDIKAAHLEDLRSGLNAMRAAMGWPALTWTQILTNVAPPAPQGYLESEHVTTLRLRMDQILAAIGISSGSYTDPSLDDKFVKAIHIEQLRERTQ